MRSNEMLVGKVEETQRDLLHTDSQYLMSVSPTRDLGHLGFLVSIAVAGVAQDCLKGNFRRRNAIIEWNIQRGLHISVCIMSSTTIPFAYTVF